MSCLTFKAEPVYDFKFRCELVCSVPSSGPDFVLITQNGVAVTFESVAVGFEQDNLNNKT